MEVLTRLKYADVFKPNTGASIPPGYYVMARDEDPTCLAIIACPKCGELQFVSTARNGINGNGQLTRKFRCKSSEVKDAKLIPKCDYVGYLQLADYERPE